MLLECIKIPVYKSCLVGLEMIDFNVYLQGQN